MKRVLMSLMVIALVGSLLGGTIAYFSDTETSTGNTFTAGTIDITLSGGGAVAHGEDLTLKPSEWGILQYRVTNAGTNPLHVFKHIISATGSEGTPIANDAELAALDAAQTIAATDLEFDLTIVTGDGPVVLIPWASPVPLESVVSHYIYLGQLGPGQLMGVVQSFHLESAVGNYAQSDVLTFDEEYIALQLAPNVWPIPVPVGTIMAALPY